MQEYDGTATPLESVYSDDDLFILLKLPWPKGQSGPTMPPAARWSRAGSYSLHVFFAGCAENFR